LGRGRDERVDRRTHKGDLFFVLFCTQAAREVVNRVVRGYKQAMGIQRERNA